MERDCESELSKLNIEQNACIYHFGASVIHGQRSNILRLRTFCSHACFYSDATVITSSSCGIENMEHVYSQLPYTMIAAGIASILFLIAGFIF